MSHQEQDLQKLLEICKCHMVPPNNTDFSVCRNKSFPPPTCLPSTLARLLNATPLYLLYPSLSLWAVPLPFCSLDAQCT